MREFFRRKIHGAERTRGLQSDVTFAGGLQTDAKCVRCLRASAVRVAAMALLSFFVASGSFLEARADAEHSEYATSHEMTNVKQVTKYGMTPIAGSLLKDGTWDIDVVSSSQFFKVESCKLTIDQGVMTAQMHMYSYSYELVYLGTAEEAAAAPYEDYIEYEDIDDYYTFTIPVEALNEPIKVASFSTKKKKWYSRNLLFDASSLDEEALNGIELPDYDAIESAVEEYDPSLLETGGSGAGGTDGSGDASDGAGSSAAGSSGSSTGSSDASVYDDEAAAELSEAMEIDLADGEYSINVDMTGGSGRAAVSTPTLMIVKDGKAYAQLLWSSTYYDWMKVGDNTYQNETTDGGNSTFTIPITAMDTPVAVVADTTAMGDPVAIDYSLTFYRESIGDKGLIPQEAAKKVIIVALVIIVGGFFLNLFVKKKKRK